MRRRQWLRRIPKPTRWPCSPRGDRARARTIRPASVPAIMPTNSKTTENQFRSRHAVHRGIKTRTVSRFHLLVTGYPSVSCSRPGRASSERRYAQWGMLGRSIARHGVFLLNLEASSTTALRKFIRNSVSRLVGCARDALIKRRSGDGGQVVAEGFATGGSLADRPFRVARCISGRLCKSSGRIWHLIALAVAAVVCLLRERDSVIRCIERDSFPLRLGWPYRPISSRGGRFSSRAKSVLAALRRQYGNKPRQKSHALE